VLFYYLLKIELAANYFISLSFNIAKLCSYLYIAGCLCMFFCLFPIGDCFFKGLLQYQDSPVFPLQRLRHKIAPLFYRILPYLEIVSHNHNIYVLKHQFTILEILLLCLNNKPGLRGMPESGIQCHL
jgi:hypothetical protein